MPNKTVRQDAHEARQHHEFNVRPVQVAEQLGIEGGARCEVPVCDAGLGQTERGRAMAHPGTGLVGEHQGDVGGDPTVSAGLCQYLHVGASAGGEDGDTPWRDHHGVGISGS